MKFKEYEAKKAEIQKETEMRLDNLAHEYAMSNNSVKIGDTVSNAVDTIIVDKIQVTTSFLSDGPSCVYQGPKITKAGKPFKNGDLASVYQTGMVPK